MPSVELPKLVNRGASGLLKKLDAPANGQTADATKRFAGPVDRIRCEGEVILIANLHHDPMNCRLHGERNMEAIKESLSQHGQMTPLTVRQENATVMKGNGTMAAARELGWTKLACSVVSMTEVEAAAYGVADNRAGEFATWDWKTLQQIEQLCSEQGQVLPGWSAGEIMALRMMNFSDVPKDPDAIPMVQGSPVTRVGDVWLMGEHRLLCGDSTKEEQVKLLMQDEQAHLLITDPPYGVSFVRGQFITDRNRTPSGRPMSIEGDERKGEEQAQFITKCFVVGRAVCAGGAVIYMFSASMMGGCYSAIGLSKSGIHLQSQLCWNKSNFVLGQADHHWKHELIWYGWYEGGTHKWFGGRDKSTIINCKKMAATYHPNEKPVELITDMIENSSEPGDLCYEPFCGSGTMLVAAQQTGRRCYAMEIDPHYCDVAVQRWCDYTSQDAIRERDGASFRELIASLPEANGEAS